MEDYGQLADNLNIKEPQRSLFIAAMKSLDDDLAKIDKEEFQPIHVLATPIVELLSVSIYSNDAEEEDEQHSQVYGTIQVIDGEGALFSLYNRDVNDTETVCNKGGLLSLNHPKDRAISPLYQVEVKIDINDKTRKASIANGLFSLDLATFEDVDYDKVHTQYVGGSCGRAAVHYIIYRHASIADVNVSFYKRKSSSDGDSSSIYGDIYGRIVASYGNTSIVLFDRTQDESVRVKYNDWIDLSRHVLVVPAVHSSIAVALDLWKRDTQEQICCKEILQYFFDEALNLPIRIRVDWKPLYCQIPPKIKLKHNLENASIGEETINSKQPQVTVCDQCHLLSDGVDGDVIPLSKAMGRLPTKLYGFQVLEVLSVLIVSDSGESFNLLGTIKVEHHWRESTTIFCKEETKDAVELLSNQTVPITAPNHIFAGIALKIKLNLKDAQDRKISMGMVRWDKRQLSDNPRWCDSIDRPLCSVIRGDIGYAAVHYAIFSKGIQATLKVSLDSDESNSNCFQVHGSVLGGYSSRYFKYVTPYEKKYFRNELFRKNPENPLVLSPGCEVPLSKSVVGVPQNSSLVVDVDLTVMTTSEDVETFHGRLNFETPHGRNYIKEQRIRGSHQHDITVSISWTDEMAKRRS